MDQLKERHSPFVDEFRCEGLADIIWTTRHHLRQLEGLREKIGDPQNASNLLPELLAGVTELLSNLVTG